ncbi:hypothetical protein [Phreatobacter oligotrophus]|uniref:Uncharacterized protein n=1 Tax=Phreatobacter oligotrophus TaxID=1122261 RepID=A0A2T4Z186_9HYPH|nr:hypothetical protein [Phreatobacter oligotrophus]PTM53498.1 hypothetical protein C8P69_106152 [Phreatobacter oligotrophus]
MDAKPTADRSLKETIRALRIDEAERTGVVVALREADLARLGMLQDRLKPVFDEVPRHVELFDTGITPGETPRLWIDMVSFVEIGRDKRSYRFLQDTRDGRRVLIESADIGAVAGRITAYVARRLIERERLLAQTPALAPEPAAGEPALPPADLPAPFVASQPAGDAPPVMEAPAAATLPVQEPPAAEAQRVRFSGFGAFVIFLIGIAAGIGGVLAVAQFAVRI